MNCAKVAREDVLEGYLLGGLSKADRDAFEEHYFECTRCFEELQTLRDIRDELRQTRAESEPKTAHTFRRWFPAALAAAIVLTVGVTVWIRSTLPAGPSDIGKPSSPSHTQVPEKSSPQQPQPTPTSGRSLGELARVEPPLYEALRLRGAGDDATKRFRRGMEHYRKADYAGAVDDLRTAADLDPGAAHIKFFLAVSYLMSGQDKAAIDQLQATIALRDSPYLEEAHFYLAKAFLRRKDLGAAEDQLKQVVQLRGSWRAEAERMITEIERLKQR